jgi:hypothetical protein
MTNNTQTDGGDLLCAENNAENYIKPTMDIYEALRWISFGLPPLRTAALEDSFLYEDVLARRMEDEPPIPEWATFNQFHHEEAELKKALVMGRLGARGFEDAESEEDAGWGTVARVLVDISHWDWFEEWNYERPHSRVNFGWHGWYGLVQFKTSDVIELFPRESRPNRVYVQDSNDIYKYFDEVEIDRPKKGRPRRDMTPVLKRIIILAMAGEFDKYLTKMRTDTSIYNVIAQDLEDNGMPLSADTIRRDYGIADLIKKAREMRGKRHE